MQAGSSAGDEAARSLQKAEDLRRRAAWHEQRAASFARGRQGELVVAQALDGLAADGYLRIDDCRWPGRQQANIDHVLIGPAGLFVIDAKNWSGRVDVRDGVLRQNGYRRLPAMEGAVAAAAAVAGVLPQRVSRIQPVLCLCGSAQLPPQTLTGGCAVATAGEIAGWIRRQPTIWTPKAVSAVFAELSGRLQTASAAAAHAVYSVVPDFVPDSWPTGPVRREAPPPMPHEPAAGRGAHRKPRSPAPARPTDRFSRRSAVIGRVLLLLLLLDAAGSAVLARATRVGDVIIVVLCATWLLRLERRRPVVIAQVGLPRRIGHRRAP